MTAKEDTGLRQWALIISVLGPLAIAPIALWIGRDMVAVGAMLYMAVAVCVLGGSDD